MSRLRVIDTGLRGARANMAFSAALVEARQHSAVPDTLRIFRFPPCVLLGRHQKLEEPPGPGIEIARRLTGGGAVYIDELQFCWELVLKTSDSLQETARRACSAIAEGISGFGVTPCFRPENDIVVNGRKLCGCAGLVDGEVQLYHGTVLVDYDPLRMTQALKPFLTIAGQSHRIVSLQELLGVAPPLNAVVEALCQGMALSGYELLREGISLEEEQAAQKWYDLDFGRDAFVLNGE
ncbi:MAG: hypothetical protein EPN26_05245 [Rhodospirillales bacterium]|nr:MAG: hypothetical protein EPN26_05245 [Rhodospirillales bacterium]